MSEHRILLLVPTRGRPDMAREMAESFLATKPVNSYLLFLLDNEADFLPSPHPHGHWGQWSFGAADVRGAVAPLNRALHHATSGGYDTIAFLNDDHRFITPDWEQRIIEARQKYAVVYPNDCFNNESALTIPFFDARIPKALGFIAPPCLCHLYSDDFWFHMGNALHSIKYLPDVKIEHVHPFSGKREMDATTAAVNTTEARERDRLAFWSYMATEFPSDVEKARKVMA